MAAHDLCATVDGSIQSGFAVFWSGVDSVDPDPKGVADRAFAAGVAWAMLTMHACTVDDDMTDEEGGVLMKTLYEVATTRARKK